MAIILGLDPGTKFTGYGLIHCEDSILRHVEHGVVAIPEALPFSHKLHFLAEGLSEVMGRFRPQFTVVEKIFLGKNADSAFKLGHARGVCMSLAARYQSEVFEYAARSAKKMVTGSGAATKEHVALVVTQLLRLKTTARLDATDALSLAIAHARQSEETALIRRMERLQQP